MPRKRVLILGGTREARELAKLLVDREVDAVTSLAGITRNPARPAGESRRGGFGGVDGLVAYLAATAVMTKRICWIERSALDGTSPAKPHH